MTRQILINEIQRQWGLTAQLVYWTRQDINPMYIIVGLKSRYVVTEYDGRHWVNSAIYSTLEQVLSDLYGRLP